MLNADRHPSLYMRYNFKISYDYCYDSITIPHYEVLIITLKRYSRYEKVIPSYQHGINHALHRRRNDKTPGFTLGFTYGLAMVYRRSCHDTTQDNPTQTTIIVHATTNSEVYPETSIVKILTIITGYPSRLSINTFSACFLPAPCTGKPIA